jgi:predicted Zn-dependent peptidase
VTEDHRLTTLPGGVRVISEALPSVRSVAIGCWIGAGSRDERAAQGGISHFIEHLLFRGSKRFTALDIAQTFDGLGGELNAETSKEYTLLHARVLDDHLETALELMGDMLRVPTFADLDAEREVVLEEIAMYADAPDDLVHDLVAAAVFGETDPLGRPVIGTEQTIGALGVPDVDAYHRAMYVDRNIVVAAAGSVEHEALVGLVSRHLAPLRKRTAPLPQRDLWIGPGPRSVLFSEKDTEQFHVCLGAPGVSRSDDRRFAASLLDAILGGTASSRLFQEIRERRGMAYSVYSYTSHYGETGQVGVYLGTRAENLRTCLQLVREQADELAAGRFEDAELERAKEHLKGRIVLSMESTSARMSRLGKSLLTGVEILSVDEIVSRIEAVTPDEVARLAGDLYGAGQLAAAGVGPDGARFDDAVEAAALQPRAA